MFSSKKPVDFFAICNFKFRFMQISNLKNRISVKLQQNEACFLVLLRIEVAKAKKSIFFAATPPKPVFTLSVFLHFMQSKRIEFSRNDFL